MRPSDFVRSRLRNVILKSSRACTRCSWARTNRTATVFLPQVRVYRVRRSKCFSSIASRFYVMTSPLVLPPSVLSVVAVLRDQLFEKSWSRYRTFWAPCVLCIRALGEETSVFPCKIRVPFLMNVNNNYCDHQK